MNWIVLSVDDLRAVAAAGEIVDGAQAPVLAAAIADAVAAVRGAVAAGNVLDADPATVPGSLRGLTARTAVFGLLETLRAGLSAEQLAIRAADAWRLTQIRDERQRVEPADRSGGGSQTVVPGNGGHSREELRGI